MSNTIIHLTSFVVKHLLIFALHFTMAIRDHTTFSFYKEMQQQISQSFRGLLIFFNKLHNMLKLCKSNVSLVCVTGDEKTSISHLNSMGEMMLMHPLMCKSVNACACECEVCLESAVRMLQRSKACGGMCSKSQGISSWDCALFPQIYAQFGVTDSCWSKCLSPPFRSYI